VFKSRFPLQTPRRNAGRFCLGAEGKVFTVRFIDSAGQIHLEETGIALLPGVDEDEYEIVK
jgi:hypothetical protein